jgi:hypothetical protein
MILLNVAFFEVSAEGLSLVQEIDQSINVLSLSNIRNEFGDAVRNLALDLLEQGGWRGRRG